MKRAVASLSLFTIALFLSLPARAEDDGQWLVGRWVGTISGYVGRSSSSRTLRVRAVSPEGIAQGAWYVTGQQPVGAAIKVAGAEVKIETAGNNVVELKRDGEDSLVGIYIQRDGAKLPIKLIREEQPF